MSSIIIPAAKSLTVTNKFPEKNLNKDRILVGCDGKCKYYSYLFFDISSIPCDVLILKAELVLFKTDNFYDDHNEAFFIRLLGDDFSSYTTYRNHPDDICNIKKEFYPITSKVAVTVDITDIILLWVKNKISNKGIVLYGRTKRIVTSFGSSKSEDEYVIPFIRVNCKKEQEHNKKDATIRQVRVTGTIGAQSKYDSVINLQVTRENGNTDNYYVADEYNNLDDSPLYIDKTYNIAIIPKESNGDQEEIVLYGAYKE